MTRPLVATVSCGLGMLALALAIHAARAMPTRVPAGAHALRMLATGAGSPTVVLETFGPACLEIWNQIQPGIEGVARVVSYDHAGYWGSEPGPKPRDARRIAVELHAALRNANLPPPYILVGYSFGGPYTRVFAGLYPNEVAGMVLVDPSQEEFMAWLNAHFPKLNVVTDADLQKQDEWGSQWISMGQAHDAILPDVPITLITAAKIEGPLLGRLIPVWRGAHENWIRGHPGARHIVTTNSTHGIFHTEPELIAGAVREMVLKTQSKDTTARR